jgi:phosphohistidine phosphatase
MSDQRLILIRHAKAAADAPNDVERPLAPRGRRDAPAIGAFLAAQGIWVDRALVSPALRARQTWSGTGVEATETVVEDRIYDNEVGSLLAAIQDTPATIRTLVLVGHNPSFGELAAELDDGTGDANARRDLLSGYPTSAVAIFEPSGAWAAVEPGSARLLAFGVGRADEPTS